jgi:hypothetical protein
MTGEDGVGPTVRGDDGAVDLAEDVWAAAMNLVKGVAGVMDRDQELLVGWGGLQVSGQPLLLV